MAIVAASIDGADASGWHDYELSIDPAYKIYRCNSLDVCLGHNDGSLIYVPDNHAETGPIVAYNVTSTHIFLRTLGRSPRNLFKGDTFEEIDSCRQFFFVLDKSNDDLAGPFSLADFQAHPVVASLGDIEWIEPRNPNVAMPLIGNLVFLVYSVIILGWPVLFLVAVMAVAWFAFRSRKRGQAYDA